MGAILSDSLRHAAEAFERHEEEACLHHLLEAWRVARAERLAALIERLSQRLTAGLMSLPCEPQSMDMARRRPVDLPRLLAGVVEAAERRRTSPLITALHEFGNWPADPRFTPALLTLARLTLANDLPIADPLGALFEDLRDLRVVVPLQALRAGLAPSYRLAQRLDFTLQRLTWRTSPTLDAEASALCDALGAALSEREADEARSRGPREELLARVYADPEDVSARMVLADHLLEREDPLGEFITLQCMPRADKARMEELQEKHRWRWAAPLGDYVDIRSVRFERGFPAAVHLRRDWAQELAEPGPCWATVRDIDVAALTGIRVVDWLAHPSLRGVKALRRVPAELALELSPQGSRLEQLGLMGPVLAKETVGLFRYLAELPHLKRVNVEQAYPGDVRLCAKSPLASRLERFEARSAGEWTLVVTRAKTAQVRATLVGEGQAASLEEAIQGARGFGVQTLRIRGVHRASPEGRQLLEQAAAGYARVEWS